MEQIDRSKTIIVIDNGTQYGQLYAKRFRDLGINVESIDAGVYVDEDSGNLIRPRVDLEDVVGYAGIIVAGGKDSITMPEDRRVDIDPRIYTEYENPIIGTCFGHQDMADRMGGVVISGLKQCGPVYTTVDLSNPLFKGLKDTKQRVNSTHNDGVSDLPGGFSTIAYSLNEFDKSNNIDAMCRPPDIGENNWRLATQFHPETFLTENGNIMLKNFAELCGLKPAEIKHEEKHTPNIDEIVEEQMEKTRNGIGDLPVFIPISGGVDSTTATRLILEAGISPDKINAFHIDTGYNRYEESKEVVEQYHKMGWNFVKLLDKKEFFANFSLSENQLNKFRPDLAGRDFGGVKLKDAVFSEHKRFLFQVAYAQVIKEYQKETGLDETNSILVQGTNHADKVESGRGGKKRSGSAHIKSHHNVGKFSDKYKKEGHLLEPLDMFFKSDIYELANRFSLPEFFSTRKPFPGPGLLIRIGNHNLVDTGMYEQEDITDLSLIANQYSSRYNISTYVAPLEAVGNFGDERAEGVIAVLQFNNNHEENIDKKIKDILYVAGQIPHYTTLSKSKCITRLITPLFEVDGIKKHNFTELKNTGETVEYLQIFDKEVNDIVDKLGIKMTQVVNYVLSDSLGESEKYTFVFRPWLAPNLMSGMPLIPEDREVRTKLFNELRALMDKHDFIGNICIDLTYKPIGGTEIN